MPPEEKTDSESDEPPTREVHIDPPVLQDGAAMWRVARDSRVLDLNSSYAYLLFARDFSRTSRVARVDGEVAGFVLGFRRPERPDCLFVWQVAVDAQHRGRQISSRLLDDVVVGAGEDHPVRVIETTITDDNAASQALFASFARRWGARITTQDLITAGHFPDEGHAAEPLYEIGPIDAGTPPAAALAAPDR